MADSKKRIVGLFVSVFPKPIFAAKGNTVTVNAEWGGDILNGSVVKRTVHVTTVRDRTFTHVALVMYGGRDFVVLGNARTVERLGRLMV